MTTHDELGPADAGLDAPMTAAVMTTTTTAPTTTTERATKPRIVTPIAVFALAMTWMIVVAMVTTMLVTVQLMIAGALSNPPGPELAGVVAKAMSRPGWMLFIFAMTGLGNVGLALLAARLSPAPLVLRLRLQAPTWRLFPLGYVLAALGMLAVGETAMLVLHVVSDTRSKSLEVLNALAADSSAPVFAVLLVLGAVLAPIGEELLFRGYIQTRFRQRFGPVVAVIATAGLFGIMHLDAIHSLAAMAMGVFVGWLTERSGSIRPAIVAHMVNNATAFTMARLWGNDDNVAWWVLPVALVVSVALVGALHRFFKAAD